MADNFDVNFLPTTLYVPCSPSFSRYIDSEMLKLSGSLGHFDKQRCDVRLLNSIFIRFHNQLRHFKFFKSFCYFRRTLNHLFDGPQTKGISRYAMLLNGRENDSFCPSVHSYDHVLICLVQTKRLLSVGLSRACRCWRDCSLHFVTGHFTKILLLIMSVVSVLRSLIMETSSVVTQVYANLLDLRKHSPFSDTWMYVKLPDNIASTEDLTNMESDIKECEYTHAVAAPSTTKVSTTTDFLLINKGASRKQTKRERKSLLKAKMAQELIAISNLNVASSAAQSASGSDLLKFLLS
ncbi:unnamed protein product [Dicrocoelium dendriticum]|nr:unnamed protein product [Dicrocoelium dendriticum]